MISHLKRECAKTFPFLFYNTLRPSSLLALLTFDGDLSSLFIVYMSCPIGKGIGQTHLAESTNNGNVSISVIETGKMKPDAIDLGLIANKLQKPLTYFTPPNARGFSSLGGLNDNDIEL